jgi:type IV pilus assembly protein PilV
MKRARGYTTVEVLIAMAVLGVGTAGVIAMQKVTAVGNREARSLALATQIARGWIDKLRADAVTWNHPSQRNAGSDLQTDTVWLKNVTNAQWFRPDRTDRGSPAADAFGNDLADTELADAVFCTNLRLGWLYGNSASAEPPLAIRAEVRVFWLRAGAGGDIDPGKPFCDVNLNAGAVSAAVDRFHFVYLTSAILENVAQ